MKWLGSSAARTWAGKAAVIRAAGSGSLPRPPPAVTTGKKCPEVKSHSVRYARRDVCRNRPERANHRTIPAC